MTYPRQFPRLSRMCACLLLIALMSACQAPANKKTSPSPATEAPAAVAQGVLRVGITPNMPHSSIVKKARSSGWRPNSPGGWPII